MILIPQPPSPHPQVLTELKCYYLIDHNNIYSKICLLLLETGFDHLIGRQKEYKFRSILK